MKFLKFEMSWYVVSHNSSYYLKMYVTEIAEFPQQLQCNQVFNHAF